MFAALGIPEKSTFIPSFWGGKEQKTRDDAVYYPRSPSHWDGAVYPQYGSVFFRRFPAEVRNEIYAYVFLPARAERVAVRAREMLRVEREVLRKEKEKEGEWLGGEGFEDLGVPTTNCAPPAEAEVEVEVPSSSTSSPTLPGKKHSPLALLLTCRLLNAEATLLAYGTHAFPTSAPHTYTTLLYRARVLSTPLFTSITCLTCPITAPHPSSATIHTASAMGDFLCTSLLLLPTLTTLIMQIPVEPTSRTAYDATVLTNYRSNNVISCASHLPHWFVDGMERCVISPVWQKGQKWDMEFPFMHAPPSHAAWRDAERVGGLCKGDCGGLLTQQGGRTVEVRLWYVWEGDAVEERRKKGMGEVILREGVERLPVERVFEGVKGKEGLVWTPKGGETGRKKDGRQWGDWGMLFGRRERLLLGGQSEYRGESEPS